MRKLFINQQGQLHSGWRLLIWLAIIIAANYAISYTGSRLGFGGQHPFLDPRWLAATDILLIFIPTALATFIMMRIERRHLSDYYVHLSQLFGALFWKGLAWGAASVSLLIGLIAAFGGYRITGLASHGSALVYGLLLWIAASLVIGIVEEFAFRAYLLRTLADGIGFWPAATVLAIGFGALHYLTKPNERWEDFACTGLLAFLLTITIRRTGNLAFAIGWHAAFDFGNIYFFAGRNAGEFAEGRLFATSWPGPDWLTGGLLGPEASWMIFVVIAGLFLVVTRFVPKTSRADVQ
ncbi:MAG TPA: type II CAAX endopeptidase family protein [Terriglobales bacterium]|jgi:membrane protease YdiL (CAAX protease family)|nr:type II CAAX endopeptidase family protein [Terriglobales bacterium]